MTTFTLSDTSPTNTVLTDPSGTVAYVVSTSSSIGSSRTTIKRGNQVIATIQWGLFQKSTITMGDKTAALDEVFPQPNFFSKSRVWTSSSGEKFKWKDSSGLYCVSVNTGLSLATYDRTLFSLFRSKKSTLEITPNGTHLTDELVARAAAAFLGIAQALIAIPAPPSINDGGTWLGLVVVYIGAAASDKPSTPPLSTMTTLTLSDTSPTNTVLTDPSGNVAYEISTPMGLGSSQTTIKRGGQVIATIQWALFKKSTITMGDRTTIIDEVFPRSRKLSTSRIWTSSSGEKFKWKDSSKLYCVSVDTGLNLATYDRTLFYLIRSKKSTLEIMSSGSHLADELVVTWAIAEKKARDRRRSRRHGGGGGGGGGDGGG